MSNFKNAHNYFLVIILHETPGSSPGIIARKAKTLLPSQKANGFKNNHYSDHNIAIWTL